MTTHKQGKKEKPEYIIARVKIRRNLGLPVKPEAEALDGKIFKFKYGWEIESDDSRYPNETAWLFVDNSIPILWQASGDLEILEEIQSSEKAVISPVVFGQNKDEKNKTFWHSVENARSWRADYGIEERKIIDIPTK